MGQNLVVMGTMLLIITRPVHVRRAFGQEWRNTGIALKNLLRNRRY